MKKQGPSGGADTETPFADLSDFFVAEPEQQEAENETTTDPWATGTEASVDDSVPIDAEDSQGNYKIGLKDWVSNPWAAAGGMMAGLRLSREQRTANERGRSVRTRKALGWVGVGAVVGLAAYNGYETVGYFTDGANSLTPDSLAVDTGNGAGAVRPSAAEGAGMSDVLADATETVSGAVEEGKSWLSDYIGEIKDNATAAAEASSPSAAPSSPDYLVPGVDTPAAAVPTETPAATPSPDYLTPGVDTPSATPGTGDIAGSQVGANDTSAESAATVEIPSDVVGNIAAGEGFYSVFGEMGIDPSHHAELMQAVGAELAEMDVAYVAAENTTLPGSDLTGNVYGWSMTGDLPPEANELILSTAVENDWLEGAADATQAVAELDPGTTEIYEVPKGGGINDMLANGYGQEVTPEMTADVGEALAARDYAYTSDTLAENYGSPYGLSAPGKDVGVHRLALDAMDGTVNEAHMSKSDWGAIERMLEEAARNPETVLASVNRQGAELMGEIGPKLRGMLHTDGTPIVEYKGGNWQFVPHEGGLPDTAAVKLNAILSTDEALREKALAVASRH